MNAQPVDVLAAMRGFMVFSGSVVPEWNLPRSTGVIADRLKLRPRERDGRVVKHKTPTTATVLRALQRAEREGHVCCVGTGETVARNWRDQSAAEAKERWWKLTDTALAQVTP